jgi:hypothetical protein
MHKPSHRSPAHDESLFDKVCGERSRSICRISSESFSLKKELEAPAKIRPRGGSLEPHRVPEKDRAEGDNACDRISEKGRIEMFEVAGTNDDEQGEKT